MSFTSGSFSGLADSLKGMSYKELVAFTKTLSLDVPELYFGSKAFEASLRDVVAKFLRSSEYDDASGMLQARMSNEQPPIVTDTKTGGGGGGKHRRARTTKTSSSSTARSTASSRRRSITPPPSFSKQRQNPVPENRQSSTPSPAFDLWRTPSPTPAEEKKPTRKPFGRQYSTPALRPSRRRKNHSRTTSNATLTAAPKRRRRQRVISRSLSPPRTRSRKLVTSRLSLFEPKTQSKLARKRSSRKKKTRKEEKPTLPENREATLTEAAILLPTTPEHRPAKHQGTVTTVSSIVSAYSRSTTTESKRSSTPAELSAAIQPRPKTRPKTTFVMLGTQLPPPRKPAPIAKRLSLVEPPVPSRPVPPSPTGSSSERPLPKKPSLREANSGPLLRPPKRELGMPGKTHSDGVLQQKKSKKAAKTAPQKSKRGRPRKKRGTSGAKKRNSALAQRYLFATGTPSTPAPRKAGNRPAPTLSPSAPAPRRPNVASNNPIDNPDLVLMEDEKPTRPSPLKTLLDKTKQVFTGAPSPSSSVAREEKREPKVIRPPSPPSRPMAPAHDPIEALAEEKRSLPTKEDYRKYDKLKRGCEGFVPLSALLHPKVVEEKGTKNVKRRSRILAELISTESTYINGLQTLLSHWVDHIPEGFLSTTVRLLIQFHAILFAKLKETENVPDVFAKNAAFLKLYTDYVSKYRECEAEIQKARNSSKFAKIVAEHQRNGKSVSSFLILPIQRIPRYELLLGSLLKHTGARHPQRKQLELALAEVRKVAEHVNMCRNKDVLENLRKELKVDKAFWDKQRVYVDRQSFLGKEGDEQLWLLFGNCMVQCTIVKALIGDDKLQSKRVIEFDSSITNMVDCEPVKDLNPLFGFQLYFQGKRSLLLFHALKDVRDRWSKQGRAAWEGVMKSVERRQALLKAERAGFMRASFDMTTMVNDNFFS